MSKPRSLLLPLSLLACLPAAAVDGVLEISQTCATASSGCFSGDSSGFPVTIDGSAGRSYRLTSDLVVGLANVDAIQISGARISLDLNGFSLVGFGIGGGTGRGVSGGGPALNARIRNGTIRGFRGPGVDLVGATAVRLEALTLELNQGGGIQTGDEALVAGNVVSNSGGIGIVVGKHSRVRDNVVSDSGGGGIVAFAGSAVSGNAVSGGRAEGIFCDEGCSVQHNTAFANDGRGIDVEAGSTLIGNAARGNGGDGFEVSEALVRGNTATDNAGDGFQSSGGSLFHGNQAKGNGTSGTGYGLRLTNVTDAYRENLITGNTSGTVLNGTSLGDNFCTTTPGCP